MRRKFFDGFIVGMHWAAALVTVGLLLFMFGFLIVQGLAALPWDFTQQQILSTLAGTSAVVLFSLFLATPVGLGTAIYAFAFAKKKTKAVLEFVVELSATIPSILFGLFGYSFFVDFLGLGSSLLSSSLTLAVMLLPTIQSTAMAALKQVPKSYSQGSLALGATPWQTQLYLILPRAGSGIILGLVLALGRALGETSALLLVLGGLQGATKAGGRTLAVQLFNLALEGASQKASRVALVLLLLILLINWVAFGLRRKLNQRQA